jgi:hypothetical protein
MAIGKISGPLLKENLLRDGVDLAFETDLLYLDVTNRRVGIKTSTPTHDLTVNGTARSTNLEVTSTADIGDITISGNQIFSNTGILNLSPGPGGHIVYQNKIVIDDLEIENNSISSSGANIDIDIVTSGTGKVNVNADMEVLGNLHATGTITADGDIVLGNASTDTIDFNADIASDIIPNVDNTYQLGTDTQRWKDVWVQNLQAQNLNTGGFEVAGIDITTRPGNTYFVSQNGDDGNSGTHPQDPLSSIGRALDLATDGDTVYIYAGVYSETMPLVVPVGVAVKGAGIRSVTVQPDSDVTVDVFLLNGESTVEDLTVTGFEYDVGTNTGYAFRFAPNMTVTSRSPYIRNVSVITAGSTVRLMTNPVDDPRGFLSGDAGKGAYVDGSIVNAASREASMLFHSVTFITPGVDAVTMTDGVRVEWLNCFTYFASKGLYAVSGSAGFASNGKTRLKVYGISAQTLNVGDTITVENVSADPATYTTGTIESFSYDAPYTNIIIDGKVSGFEESLSPPDTDNQQIITFSGGQTASHLSWADYSDFGAEIRSIASASVYGNYGAYGDGEGVIGYFIGSNFAYIGTGRLSNNDPLDVIQVNEVVQLNRAKLYYTSVDAQGDFRVGEFFLVDQQTGNVTFSEANVTISSPSGIVFTDGVNTTEITPTKVETGNIRISGNTIESTSGGITLDAANNQINTSDNVNITGNLDVSGTVSVDSNTVLGTSSSNTLTINSQISSNVIPNVTGLHDLGSTSFSWNNVYLSNFISDTILISGNVIQTTVSNADLELRANGTGNILISSDDLIVNGDVTVSGSTNLTDVTVSGSINVSSITTNNLTVNNTTTVINDIEISGNQIRTTVSNSDLELVANATGIISIPENNLVVDQNLTVSLGTTNLKDTNIVGNLTASNVITTNITTASFATDTIRIQGNVVETIVSNSDLELRANGTGQVTIPNDSLVVGQNLTVQTGTTDLLDTNIVGTLTASSIVTTTITSSNFATDTIRIQGNVIETIVSNADLELRANGTGTVVIPNDNLTVNQNLNATLGTTSLNTTNVSGTFTVTNLTTNSSITSSTISTNDIEISGNVIRTTQSNSNLELRANGTGFVVAENFEFSGSSISGTAPEDMNLTPSGTGIVAVNSNQSLKIPTGTELQRPISPQAGMVRFNSTSNYFEGYNGSHWIRLGGVFDVDNNTYILPETSPGANENTLYFYTNGNLSATLDSNQFTVNKLVVDNTEINGNVISTTGTNTDLELLPNGTGTVVFDNFKFGNNIILNTTSNAVTEFRSTGQGYYHIVGTNAVGIPAGGNSGRPLVPAQGMMRYNTDTSIVEIYTGTAWVSVAGASSGITIGIAEDIALTSALIFG